MRTPVFPDDFRVLRADGGASYWWWGPTTGPEYDGTWPVGTDPPSGLMVADDDGAGHELADGRQFVVSWEYGPETESGPWRLATHDGTHASVQRAVDAVCDEVRRERDVASRL